MQEVVYVQVLSRERNQNAAASMVSPTFERQPNWVRVGDHIGTNRYQPMVLQNGCFAVSKTFGNLLALFAVQHNATKVWIYSVALVEAQTVLCDHVELAAKNAPRFAVHAARPIS